MKLLISPLDELEALEAIAGGADIIDVKNPHEGSFGASFPWVIRRIREITPKTMEVSCTLGDLPNMPGSVALAAYGASLTGVNYIKCSLCDVKTKAEAVWLMKNVVRAVREFSFQTNIVAAGFADAYRIDSVDPSFVPHIAQESGANVAMLDTAIKDGRDLFTFLNEKQLRTFIDESHKYNLRVALAGCLKKEHLQQLSEIKTDIVGMRSAACSDGDRLKGRIVREKVAELVKTTKLANKENLID